MRLFTGIDLPDEIKERLDVLITHLRNTAHLKWSPAYNLHITTKFIGEWPPERLDELIARLAAIECKNRIDISVEELGWFPNPHHPRVFWAGVKASPSLAELARATDEALAELGVAPEARPYAPHLTLARIKEAVTLSALQRAISALKSTDFGRFTAPAFYLYLSRRGAGGAVYTKLREFPLPTA